MNPNSLVNTFARYAKKLERLQNLDEKDRKIKEIVERLRFVSDSMREPTFRSFEHRIFAYYLLHLVLVLPVCKKHGEAHRETEYRKICQIDRAIHAFRA